MKGLLYLILSVLIAAILMILGVVYACVYPERSKYFTSIAESIDRLGNVVCSKLFNKLLIKKEGYQFGDPREWISSVIGKNKLAGTLTFCGKLCDKILDLIQRIIQ